MIFIDRAPTMMHKKRDKELVPTFTSVPKVCWETRKYITSTREGRSVAVIEEGLGGQHTLPCTPHVRVNISEPRTHTRHDVH